MQLTANTQAFIEAEQYSQFILKNLHDGLLGEQFYRNVTDFASGTTLNIKSVGTVTLQEAAEDAPLEYNPIETGEITMQITEYEGDAWYVTDDLREDGTNIEMLMAERAAESTRAYQEVFESKFLKVCNDAQTDANANLVNGFPHRIASAATNDVVELDAFIKMRLAFDKANAPAEGRVAILDPVCEATLNRLVTITHDVTPFGKDILNSGMSRGMRFVQNLFGWDIILSNRLDKGDFGDGTETVTDGVANVFMCVADDQTKPVMMAMRRPIKVEGERNKDRRRDEFVSTSRYGFGVQRVDTLGIYITSATNF